MTDVSHRTGQNPYTPTATQPAALLPSAVAFVDILGYETMVRAAHDSRTSEVLLRRLHSVIPTALDRLRKPAHNKLGMDHYIVRAFTDNVVIGYPLEDDGEPQLGHLLQLLAYFQCELASEGFFIRGGVAVGPAFISEDLVFGPALLDAYDGEHTLARDPRIVLTESARMLLEKHICYYRERIESPHAQLVFSDPDGMYFINYLYATLDDEFESVPNRERLHEHRAAVERQMTAYRSKPPIWSKYAWSATYHNFFCAQHSSAQECYIDLDRFRAGPDLIGAVIPASDIV